WKAAEDRLRRALPYQELDASAKWEAKLRRADLAKLAKRCKWATAFGVRQRAAALLAAARMAYRLGVNEGRAPIPLLHHFIALLLRRTTSRWNTGMHACAPSGLLAC